MPEVTTESTEDQLKRIMSERDALEARLNAALTVIKLDETHGKELTTGAPGPTAPMSQVPQLTPDAIGMYVDPGQVALTLATQFHPFEDGTVKQVPTPVLVLRLQIGVAENLATQLLEKIKGIKDALQAQAQDATKVQIKTKLKAVPNASELT